MAFNTIIQGTASDIIKIAMKKIYQKILKTKIKAEIIMQVHDELVFEVPKSELDNMKELVKDISNKLNNYSTNQIEITDYCIKKMFQRNLDETLLISTLFSEDSLYYVKEQIKPHKGESEKRYKLVFKISSRYSLIIIVAFYPNILKVINTIKTSKGFVIKKCVNMLSEI